MARLTSGRWALLILAAAVLGLVAGLLLRAFGGVSIPVAGLVGGAVGGGVGAFIAVRAARTGRGGPDTEGER